MQNTRNRKIVTFIITSMLLVIAIIYSIITGSIHITFKEIIGAILGEYNQNIDIVLDLRMPRIILSVVAGGGIAVAGVLLQSAMRNPLADAGILGINSGASLITIIVAGIFPSLYFFMPMFAFVGGVGTFFILYLLNDKENSGIMKILLIGIIINTIFMALIECLKNMMGGNDVLAKFTQSSINMKNWNDVIQLTIIIIALMIVAFIISPWCDILGMEDKTVNSLGINADKTRMLVAILGVAMASVCVGYVGNISFLGIIAPFIARKVVGNRHRVLIPYALICGALLLLLADTTGRVLAAPNEIAASIIMAVVGGPCFIILLRRNKVKNAFR